MLQDVRKVGGHVLCVKFGRWSRIRAAGDGEEPERGWEPKNTTRETMATSCGTWKHRTSQAVTGQRGVRGHRGLA
jgi:hypothetical protein